jgi:hypothetical protein
MTSLKTGEAKKRSARYYAKQVLTPNSSVSSRMNATDSARQKKRSKIREPATSPIREPQAPLSETHCDITLLLQDTPKVKSKVVAEVAGDNEWAHEKDEMIPESTMDDDVGKCFEFIESELVYEHNGQRENGSRELDIDPLM